VESSTFLVITSPSMFILAFVLAHLASHGSARRVNSMHKKIHDGDASPRRQLPAGDRQREVPTSLEDLPLLLRALAPAAGWQAAGMGPAPSNSVRAASGDKPRTAIVMLEDWGGGPGFWNERYEQKAETFDWLEEYSDLRDVIEEVTKGSRSARFLNVGCGNSPLPEQMYDDGYHNIDNIDYSDIVISQMQQRNLNRSEMRWTTMDARQMTYENNTFDVIIDKGTLDAFSCMKGNDLAIACYLTEAFRVLRPGGVYLCNTFGTPKERAVHFERPHLDWTRQETKFAPGSVIRRSYQAHFLYIYKATDSEAKNDGLLEKLVEVSKEMEPEQGGKAWAAPKESDQPPASAVIGGPDS